MATSRKAVRTGTQKAAQGTIAASPAPAPAQAPSAAHTPPHLTASSSHLDKAPNPKPEWPDVKGLFGTGAISLIARLDEAMERRTRSIAEQVDTLRAAPQVGAFKAAVLEWMSKEGL